MQLGTSIPETFRMFVESTYMRRLLDAPKIFLRMLSLFTVDDVSLRNSLFLQHADAVLRGLYSETAENIPTAVQALGHIRRIVQDCPPNAILPVLSSLADGLSAWIGDEDEVLLVHDHNDVVSNFNRLHLM